MDRSRLAGTYRPPARENVNAAFRSRSASGSGGGGGRGAGASTYRTNSANAFRSSSRNNSRRKKRSHEEPLSINYEYIPLLPLPEAAARRTTYGLLDPSVTVYTEHDSDDDGSLPDANEGTASAAMLGLTTPRPDQMAGSLSHWKLRLCIAACSVAVFARPDAFSVGYSLCGAPLFFLLYLTSSQDRPYRIAACAALLFVPVGVGALQLVKLNENRQPVATSVEVMLPEACATLAICYVLWLLRREPNLGESFVEEDRADSLYVARRYYSRMSLTSSMNDRSFFGETPRSVYTSASVAGAEGLASGKLRAMLGWLLALALPAACAAAHPSLLTLPLLLVFLGRVLRIYDYNATNIKADCFLFKFLPVWGFVVVFEGAVQATLNVDDQCVEYREYSADFFYGGISGGPWCGEHILAPFVHQTTAALLALGFGGTSGLSFTHGRVFEVIPLDSLLFLLTFVAAVYALAIPGLRSVVLLCVAFMVLNTQGKTAVEFVDISIPSHKIMLLVAVTSIFDLAFFVRSTVDRTTSSDYALFEAAFLFCLTALSAITGRLFFSGHEAEVVSPSNWEQLSFTLTQEKRPWQAPTGSFKMAALSLFFAVGLASPDPLHLLLLGAAWWFFWSSDVERRKWDRLIYLSEAVALALYLHGYFFHDALLPVLGERISPFGLLTMVVGLCAAVSHARRLDEGEWWTGAFVVSFDERFVGLAALALVAHAAFWSPAGSALRGFGALLLAAGLLSWLCSVGCCFFSVLFHPLSRGDAQHAAGLSKRYTTLGLWATVPVAAVLFVSRFDNSFSPTLQQLLLGPFPPTISVGGALPLPPSTVFIASVSWAVAALPFTYLYDRY